MRRGAGNHAADNTVSGIVSTGATWVETFLIKDQDGNNVTGLTNDDFQFQFRCSEADGNPVMTLSTAAGTLSVSEVSGTTQVAINVPAASLSLVGDYVADLVSKAASDGRLTHRAHGLVTFQNNPITF